MPRIQQRNQASIEQYYKNTVQNNKAESTMKNNEKYQIIRNKMETHWPQSLPSRLTDEEKHSIIVKIMRFYDAKGNLTNPKGIAGIKLQGRSPAEVRQIIGVERDTEQKPSQIIKDEFIQQNVLQNDIAKNSNAIINYKNTISHQEDRYNETGGWHRFGSEYFAAIYNAINKNYFNWKQRFSIDYKNNNGFKVFVYGILIISFILLLFFIII